MGDNTYCDACEYLVREVASDGCSLACQQMPPPADALCAWLLQSTGLCAWVVQELTGGANAMASAALPAALPSKESSITKYKYRRLECSIYILQWCGK